MRWSSADRDCVRLTVSGANGSAPQPTTDPGGPQSTSSSLSPPANGSDLGALIAAQIKPLVERLDRAEAKSDDAIRRVGKNNARSRGADGKFQSAEADASDSSPAPQALTREDLEGAMQLGRLTAKLSDEAQKALQETMSRHSLSYAAAADIATMLASGHGAAATAAGTGRDAPVPTGAAATSAPRTSPAHPRSLMEFAELAKTDPERFRQLKADPTFHPDELPHIVRERRD